VRQFKKRKRKRTCIIEKRKKKKIHENRERDIKIIKKGARKLRARFLAGSLFKKVSHV
jgi:hypothetical protein